MAKRRTKKQKLAAKHSFQISWEGTQKKSEFQARVKGQKKNTASDSSKDSRNVKNPINLEKDANSKLIKQNLTRSLIISGLILGIEMVIYLAWKV